ncbi:hypothetical protein [Desulforamulus putei]|uniref:Uncharacterized protein n=1 Tax=Desulforamulus putei DSM 12395 TaxID=1121429 RepID=A0A1M5CG30_9FIRM|nr:hypothetical protein [Desulforamulus putei]SHF53705.1 hypothetical protein SAMN02745133_02915 [Desulforamulus putei DSM 12395]
MQYLITWIEGEEVFYCLVPHLNFDHSLLEEKNLIITKIDEEESEQEKQNH